MEKTPYLDTFHADNSTYQQLKMMQEICNYMCDALPDLVQLKKREKRP